MQNYCITPLGAGRKTPPNRQSVLDSPAIDVQTQTPKKEQAAPADTPEPQLIKPKKSIMDAKKQRAVAQIAVTAGFGTAAYFLWNVNRVAAIIFTLASLTAAYTVVMPYERKDGSVRQSAISNLKAA